MKKPINPIHPGQILMEEFVIASASSLVRVAEATGIALAELEALVRGERDVTSSMAAALALVWKTTPEFWLNLQRDYESRVSGMKKVISG